MEKADLAQKFGADYDRYLAEVKRWGPRLTPFAAHNEGAPKKQAAGKENWL